MGLKPRSLARVRLKRRKRLGKPHSGGANREMFKSTSLRESSSSELSNVSKVNFVLILVTFQEVLAKKIDFRCTGKG